MQRLEFVLHNLDTLSTLSSPDTEGLLWFSSEGEDVAVRDFIVRRRTEPNCRDRNGCTPLILAAAHGHVKVVRVLLELGASINDVASGGLSPLVAAAVGRHSETVQILCSNVDPIPDYQQGLIRDGATSLHIGVQHGDPKLCSILLHGASVLVSPLNTPDKLGCTPLFRAVQ